MTGSARQPLARLATARDVPDIVRICSDGWRDTYRDREPAPYIEQVIAEFYTPERVASEIGGRRPAYCGDGESLRACRPV